MSSAKWATLWNVFQEGQTGALTRRDLQRKGDFLSLKKGEVAADFRTTVERRITFRSGKW